MNALQNILKTHENIRFYCSDIAAIAGFHPYMNIVELFDKYLYQDLALLREIDAKTLGVEFVTIHEEVKQIVSKLSTEHRDIIQKIEEKAVTDLTNHHKAKSMLETVQTMLKKDENKILEQITVQELELLEDEYSGRIRKQYGRNCEDKSLNRYEEITGYEVVERNATLYILEVPPFSGKESCECVDDSKEIQSLPITDPTVPSLHRQPSVSSTTTSSSNSNSIPDMEVIDLTAENSNPPYFHLPSNLSTTTTEPKKKTEMNGQDTLATDTTKVDDPSSSNSEPINPFILMRSANQSSKKRKERPKKLKPAFSLIGRVDGVSYQLDTRSEDATQWMTIKVVVEMKNRVKRISQPPPMYEQIQLVSYMIMLDAICGDLVQVMAEEDPVVDKEEAAVKPANVNEKEEGSKVEREIDQENNSMQRGNINSCSNSCSSRNNACVNNQVTGSTAEVDSVKNEGKIESGVSEPIQTIQPASKRESTIAISRIHLDGPPYYHHYYWDTVILPRLHVFRDAILTLRLDDSLRYSFLLAGEDMKRAIVTSMCPYL